MTSRGLVSRLTNAGVAFVVGGAVAATAVISRGAFAAWFFFLFFGSIVGLFAWLAGGRWRSAGNVVLEESLNPKEPETRSPFADEFGVHRYPGDTFDVENHPLPGAMGRVDRPGLTSPLDDRL